MAMPAEAGRVRLRPTLKTSLAAGLVFLLLVGLGSWQVQRLFWKADLIETRETRSAMEPVSLLALGEGPESFEFRRVSAHGRFLHDQEIYLAARSLNGRPGYHLLTPFALEGGGSVLVNRGWIPLEKKLPEARPEGQLEGQLTLEGIFRMPPEPGWFTPDNAPGEDVWYWIDLRAMALRLGAPLEPFVVEAGPEPNPGGLPIGGQTRITLANDHLQYAITWYGFALTLAVIFVLYHRRRRPAKAGDE